MSKILNQPQAKAVYAAICALNNVGALPLDLLVQRKTKNTDQIKASVGWKTGMVYVNKGRPIVEREAHADANAFAAAYNLEN